MAVTIARDALNDAQVTDGICRGDAGAAARLWVRHWPTALNAARELVEPAEVPGLAAEALIGTVAAIAVGRGPREDVAGFVRDAVRELGEDDVPPPPPAAATHPDVFASPLMSRVFADLPHQDQEVLWFTVIGEHADELIAEALGISASAAAEVRDRALTALQRDYVAEHTARAESDACRAAHASLWAAVEGADRAGLSGETWVHLSSCAWCTEAFHEVAFSNVAISSLVDRSLVTPVAPVVETIAAAPVVAAPVLLESDPIEPDVERADEDDTVPVAVVPAEATGPLVDSRTAAGAALLPGRRRGRVVAVVAAAVVATAVIVVGVAAQGGNDDPPAATGNDDPTGLPLASESVEPPVAGDLPTASSTPTAPSALGAPSSSATPSPSAGTSDEPATTPTAKPTVKANPPKPSQPAPQPSSTPQPTTEPTTPAPSPSPTPTERPCNGLQHLLGIC